MWHLPESSSTVSARATILYNKFENCTFKISATSLRGQRVNTISTFQAYDQHLNMILGEVEETVTTMEIDEETYEEIYKVMDNGCLCAWEMGVTRALH